MDSLKKNTLQKVLVLGLFMSIVLNTVALVWIYKLDKHLDVPITVYTSCSGNAYQNDKLEGILKRRINGGTEINENGFVPAVVEFNLSEKEPRTEVLLQHRIRYGDEYSEWQTTVPKVAQPLMYFAELELELKSQRVEYRIVQQLDDEIIKASSVEAMNFEFGKGEIEFHASEYSNSNKISFLVLPEHTPITAYQVEEVFFTIRKGEEEEAYRVLSDGGNYEFECEANHREQIDLVSIRVVYKDGEVLTADMEPPYAQYPNPILTR